MAEIAGAVAAYGGVAATVGAAHLTHALGFAGRHETCYRNEDAEMHRTMDKMAALKRVDLSDSRVYARRLKAVKEKSKAYDRSIKEYKLSPGAMSKFAKREEVRRMKRAFQDANKVLKDIVDDVASDDCPMSRATSLSAAPISRASEMRHKIGAWQEGLRSDRSLPSLPPTEDTHVSAFQEPVARKGRVSRLSWLLHQHIAQFDCHQSAISGPVPQKGRTSKSGGTFLQQILAKGSSPESREAVFERLEKELPPVRKISR